MQSLRNNFYTMDELMAMPLITLRGLDIYNAEQEEMVQAAVNTKLRAHKEPVPISRAGVPDIKTKEEEEVWQRILDERNAEARVLAQLEEAVVDPVVDAPVEIPAPEVIPVIIEPTPIPEPVVVGAFCAFCDSKGVRHKKTCTRPQN
jgi:hypothetical protein